MIHFGCLERPWGHSGPPLSIFHRFSAKSSSKRGHKWRPFGLFGFLLGHLGPHLEEMGSEMRCPRVPKSDFMDIMKTLIFLRFFMLFGGLGPPMELQMVVLRRSWGQLGIPWVAFGRLFCMCLPALNFASNLGAPGAGVGGRGEAPRAKAQRTLQSTLA